MASGASWGEAAGLKEVSATTRHLLGQLPAYARRAVAAHLAVPMGGPPPGAPPSTAPRCPVFVTLRDAAGALRGCIGTLTPATDNVFLETERAAVLAASGDPRFPPVVSTELNTLSIEVSVLMPEVRVAALGELDPARYGVVVRGKTGQRGVLLPNVPGVVDARQQWDIAREKGQMRVEDVSETSRFEVLKYTEAAG